MHFRMIENFQNYTKIQTAIQSALDKNPSLSKGDYLAIENPSIS